MPVKLSAYTMRTTGVAVALLLASTGAAWADAPVPACKGHDPAAAATSKAEGVKHYRASKREGRDDAEMATALGFFEAACAAGDDTALELRAYALAAVERFVEAAQTLDVFLAAHPIDGLPAATRDRVQAQQPEILARVASLTVETPAPGAHVAVNHQPAGVTPLAHLRLAPGRYDIEVTPDGEPAVTRSLDLAAGEHTESFAPPKVEVAAPAPPPPPPPSSSGGFLTPPVLGAAIGGGALLVTGITGAIWASERVSVYNAAKCDGSSTHAGCSGALSQYYAGRDLEIIGFVGAGLGAAGAGVLYYLGQQKQGSSHGATTPSPRAVSCSFLGTGASCSGTF